MEKHLPYKDLYRREGNKRLTYRKVHHLTDMGMREIGQLSDPHFELMQRLDLAIVQIQQDRRLSEPQKQQTINWLEEGKIVARTLI